MVIPLDDDFFVIPITSAANTGGIMPSGFDYVRQNEQILTGFPIGHNLPLSSNQLFYNLELDGYGGLPFGSCLTRSYLMDNNDPNKDLCAANENRDLMRVWANRNSDLKNVLLKNMTIKNAFRSYNVVDGDVVTSSSGLPHTDTFQMFYLDSSEEDPDWFGIQDTIIKNSDNSLMITGGGRFKGAVYQNLKTFCDSEFFNDDAQRVANDYAQFAPTQDVPTNYGCTNPLSFASFVAADVWLIEVRSGNDGTSSIQISNQAGPVIAIGTDSGNWEILTRDQNNKLVSHPNVIYYASIEAALEVESRPPFIEYSCAGWSNPPKGCENRLGYFN